ncbi:single-stranded DNA-binding protein [Lacticaseibacillus zhaodongensis]|uniref:single-stranded DNA-binding protein n=1 Tax=Lacticaseibacillus zhaodongensis TaxID=2668065 RepID=UPI0012D32B14|nr:single-stranded DNA-binding protein [Lacticaseibacillus zhaodongensis]
MINQVALTGRLTKDAELRYTQSGTAVATFTLAVDRQFTNAAGERETDFISCQVWRKKAENLSNLTHKGVLIGVEGRIATRTYDNAQGQRVYVTEVVVDNFALLESRNHDSSQNQQQGRTAPTDPVDRKPGNEAQQQSQQHQTPPAANQGQQSKAPAKPTNPDPFADNGKPINIDESDLPF